MNKDALNSETISYEVAKKLARDEDPEVRQVLATRKDIKPEILYFLAEDTDAAVRLAVANNLSAPRKADVILAKDDDVTVRGDLAGKIARLAPGLSVDEQDKAQRATYEALETLAKDQIAKVRGILSEALKDIADAPPDVIKTLAMDTEIEVSGPVLEFSPVLSDDDLLQIIEQGPAQGGLNAISKRAGVTEPISDAIVGTDDVAAIADLLSNDSAQIREATLDDLIDRAPDVELWHAPLTGRPKLPNGAEVRLAGFLADNLLSVLQERADLDADTLDAVKAVVHKRIGDEGMKGMAEAESGQDFINMEAPLDMVRRLYQARKLDGNVIGKALNAGDYSFVFAAMVVRSELDEAVVKRTFVEKSARGICAAAWKASLSAKMAAQIQQRMGRIGPSDVVAADGDKYALSQEDLEFQIEFFSDLSSKGTG
ncbi:MAG: DUF2336 domain-containing protein [Rhodospirillales bacterium]|nr:DUF2336 domain-containing protein [Alphaproteobacteria bacterium]MBL6948670.1 DUF2336 domain-containing protein [Rhodospirillales bacterium]